MKRGFQTKAKTVFITGASRGIGKAIALEFAKNGWNLALCCQNQKDSLLQVKKECESLGCSCLIDLCDVSNPTQVSECICRILDEFGTIHCLINNDGISYTGLLTDMELQEWENIISTNLSSCYYTCKCIIPEMIHLKQGTIINISSVWGEHGGSCEVAYSASKGGMNAFTKALAKELAPSGITVNAIAFGFIDTEMNQQYSDDEKQAHFEEIPAGRPGSTDEAAKIVYQVSTSPSYLTGQIITMDGGWL